MAKIGTAHIEIKPVLDEVQFAALCQRIEDAIIAAVDRGLTNTKGDLTDEERQFVRGGARLAHQHELEHPE